jgi:CubicO group peptidase (beta-lactamase class C family)
MKTFSFLLVSCIAFNTVFALSPKLNKERLEIIHEHLNKNLNEKKIPGAVVLVAQNHKIICSEAVGFADMEKGKKISKDQVFRLASMSKPITGTAILMLVDQGKISLTDPLSKYIPDFKELMVAIDKNHTVPSNREVTIKDLLTHSSGIGQGGLSSDYMEKIRHNPGESLAEYIPKLAKAPLDFQPGTKTGYSALAGFDILGRVVEIVSGERLDHFLSVHLFKPLEMKHTGFANLPKSIVESLPNMYKRTDQGLIRDENQEQTFLDKTYFSGAAGMIGNIEDYVHFVQMLADKGSYKGKQLLSRHIVEEMTSPQLPDSILFYPGQTWGLSVRVITKDNGSAAPLTKGCFGWSGAWGTHFWADPVHQINALYMTNVSNIGGAGADTARELERDVMQALED